MFQTTNQISISVCHWSRCWFASHICGLWNLWNLWKRIHVIGCLLVVRCHSHVGSNLQSHRIRMYAMIMVTFTINIPQFCVRINLPYDWIRHGKGSKNPGFPGHCWVNLWGWWPAHRAPGWDPWKIPMKIPVDDWGYPHDELETSRLDGEIVGPANPWFQ